MSELTDKIAELKIKHPTLLVGFNDEIVEMSKDEYEATIAQWAQHQLDNLIPPSIMEQSTPSVIHEAKTK
jgi:hypothetical protein